MPCFLSTKPIITELLYGSISIYPLVEKNHVHRKIHDNFMKNCALKKPDSTKLT